MGRFVQKVGACSVKALTIKQPWASLIMFGGKDIENRDWFAPRSLFGQRIAIHSSKKLDEMEFQDAEDMCLAAGLTWPQLKDEWTQGGVILGTVILVQCVSKHPSPWFVGEYGFVLAAPRPIIHPIEIRGQLGFWDVPTEIAAQLERAA
jgi:hypothetical protein